MIVSLAFYIISGPSSKISEHDWDTLFLLPGVRCPFAALPLQSRFALGQNWNRTTQDQVCDGKSVADFCQPCVAHLTLIFPSHKELINTTVAWACCNVKAAGRRLILNSKPLGQMSGLPLWSAGRVQRPSDVDVDKMSYPSAPLACSLK